MANRKSSSISPTADRMGRFIGQLRIHEGVTQKQLARGLCTSSLLGRIENGEREAGKQLTDAFFQRLGKPAELFERILDLNEFQMWSRRQEIIAHLRRGNIDAARSAVSAYMSINSGVLDRQFSAIVTINCRFLSGASAAELLAPVRDALRLTQPGFLSTSINKMLLSQNEGRLLFAYLRLREETEGFSAVARDYTALLHYFRQKRYESRERVYLFPYVACRVIENEYREGNYENALTVCEDALEELTREKRLFAYDQLLDWKQKLFDAMGNPDQTPRKLLEQLRLILADVPKQAELLIPCDERGHVYCLNHVIRDRRKLLGITQEKLAEGICEPRTISRIENHGRNLHRLNRQQLLRRVNMSGERYDYEVITDRYEDYLLRSELDRAIVARKTDSAKTILTQLSNKIPDILTNQQHVSKIAWQIDELLPFDNLKPVALEKALKKLKAVLRLTLPLDLDQINDWPVSILSINEILTLVLYAAQLEKHRKYERALSILLYVRNCLENTGVDVTYYGDVYTRVESNLSSVLGNSEHYKQSVHAYLKCLRACLENKSSERLAQCIYGIACNLASGSSSCTEETIGTLTESTVSTLQQAYVAARISGDSVGQEHIAGYCRKEYGIEIAF